MVIEMASEANNRRLYIKRPNNQIQEVDRIRVRPHQAPNMLRISAINPASLPSSIKAQADDFSDHDLSNPRNHLPVL